jgi:CO dehydrogenase maturation factor
MIIAFVGKGGSGKSTLSAWFAKFLHKQGNTVLAVDADHNMDLAFHLGADGEMAFLGNALDDILRACGLDPVEQKYRQAFFQSQAPAFALHPPDSFTKKYAKEVRGGLFVMASGPHTDRVLHGQYCSHSLSTPLKVYLPFLRLARNEYVVVDEKAGADGAGTGIASGFDFAYVVVEPTAQGFKTAKQIADLLDFYGTPYALIINKVMDAEDAARAQSFAHREPVHFFPHDRRLRDVQGDMSDSIERSMLFLQTYAQTHGSADRCERSRKKFERNRQFEEFHQSH